MLGTDSRYAMACDCTPLIELRTNGLSNSRRSRSCFEADDTHHLSLPLQIKRSDASALPVRDAADDDGARSPGPAHIVSMRRTSVGKGLCVVVFVGMANESIF